MNSRNLLNLNELALLLGLDGDGSMKNIESLTRAQTELRIASSLLDIALGFKRNEAYETQREADRELSAFRSAVKDEQDE